MVALQQKRIGCNFCHRFILGAVGSLALSISTRDLNNRFSSVMDANDYFIDVIINSYLTTALHAFRSNARKVARLKRKTWQAKLQRIRKIGRAHV